MARPVDTAVTLPTRPPAATTGWPTLIPLDVPRSSSMVCSKLAAPEIHHLGGDGGDGSQVAQVFLGQHLLGL